MKKLCLICGTLLILSVFTVAIANSDLVICISSDHVAIEKSHDQNQCADKIICESNVCDDVEVAKEHQHCDSKKDCGDCTDIQVSNTFNFDKPRAIELSSLLFVAKVNVSDSQFVTMPDLKRYRLNVDVPLNDLSPSHEFKLINTLLV